VAGVDGSWGQDPAPYVPIWAAGRSPMQGYQRSADGFPYPVSHLPTSIRAVASIRLTLFQPGSKARTIKGDADLETEMLTWKQGRDGWVSNGYRIELLEPCHWVLLKNEPAQPVQVEPIPLAETHTLTQCKRKADLLDKARRLTRIRRRLWAELIVTLVAFALVPIGMAPPWVFLVLLVVATRAIGLLAGTYSARSHVAVWDMSGHTGPIAEDRLTLWVTRHLGPYRHS